MPSVKNGPIPDMSWLRRQPYVAWGSALDLIIVLIALNNKEINTPLNA